MVARSCRCGGRIINQLCDRCGPVLPAVGVRLSSHKRGYNAEWDRKKEDYLKRQRPVAACICCAAQGIVNIKRGRTGLLVDHIVPAVLLPEKEFWNESNWQVLCLDCDNRFKKPLEKRVKIADLLKEEWFELLNTLRLEHATNS